MDGVEGVVLHAVVAVGAVRHVERGSLKGLEQDVREELVERLRRADQGRVGLGPREIREGERERLGERRLPVLAVDYHVALRPPVHDALLPVHDLVHDLLDRALPPRERLVRERLEADLRELLLQLPRVLDPEEELEHVYRVEPVPLPLDQGREPLRSAREEPHAVEHRIGAQMDAEVGQRPLHRVRRLVHGEGERDVDDRRPVDRAFVERAPRRVGASAAPADVPLECDVHVHEAALRRDELGEERSLMCVLDAVDAPAALACAREVVVGPAVIHLRDGQGEANLASSGTYAGTCSGFGSCMRETSGSGEKMDLQVNSFWQFGYQRAKRHHRRKDSKPFTVHRSGFVGVTLRLHGICSPFFT